MKYMDFLSPILIIASAVFSTLCIHKLCALFSRRHYSEDLETIVSNKKRFESNLNVDISFPCDENGYTHIVVSRGANSVLFKDSREALVFLNQLQEIAEEE